MRGRYRYLHRRTVLYSFVLHLLFKKSSRRCDKLFSVLPASKALSFLVTGVTYLYKGVTAASIVVLSFLLL